MFNIVFYEDKNGYSELHEYLLNLLSKSNKNKDARIQFKQFTLCIELLSKEGTMLLPTIVKHITDEIWELRPGNNRILFFYFKNNSFVLLHHFRKTTQKTPKLEIEKAKREIIDYKIRNGG